MAGANQAREADDLFRFGIWWSGALLAHKYVLCFTANQMVNKIFSRHTTSSPQRGDWLVQNRVIAEEGTNCKWQEAAGQESTICFLWQSQRPELGTACVCSRPRAPPQRTVESVIKGLLQTWFRDKCRCTKVHKSTKYSDGWFQIKQP